MSPLKVVDPVAPARSQRNRNTRWVSLPIVLMIICSVAALPPIAKSLLSLDSVIHEHNDVIVTSILWIAPFCLVGLTVAGLVALYRNRHSAPRRTTHI